MNAVCRILALAASLAAFGALASPAAARNDPIAASPSVSQTVGQAPASVTLAMKEAVKGPAVISVTGPGGKVVSEPSTTILSTNIAVDLTPGLSKGTYTVKYRIEGPNGPEGGTYQFAYGSGSFSVKGIKTWGGYKAIPKALKLDGDDKKAAEAASATPTPNPTDAPTAAPTDQATPGSAGGDDDSSLVSSATDNPGWIAGGLALVVAAVILGLLARRRFGVRSSDDVSP